MQTEFTLLLLILVPLLTAGVLLLWSLRPPARFRMMFLWLALNAGVGLTAALLLSEAALLNASTGLTTGVISSVQNLPLLQLDRESICWLIASGTLTLLLLHWPTVLRPAQVRFREAALGLTAFAASTVAIFADGVWLQWGASMVTGWLLFFILTCDPEQEQAESSAGTCLIWWTLADFSWIFGLLTLEQVWTSPRLSVLTNWEHLQGLSPEQMSLTVLGQLFLLVALIMRSGLFPLMIWTRHVPFDFRKIAWVLVFGMGLSGMVFLRWGPMWNAFAETHQLITGVGMFSVIMLSLQSAFGLRGSRRLLAVASSQIGLVWLGQGMSGDTVASFALLTLVSVISLAAILAVGLDHLSIRPPGSLRVPAALLFIPLLVCCGASGQERLVATIGQGGMIASMTPSARLAAILSAQMFCTVALFRELFRPLLPDRTEDRERDAPAAPSPWSWWGLGVLSLLLLIGFWGVILSTDEAFSFRVQIPLLPIVMLIGCLVAKQWTTPAFEQALDRSPFSRMTRHDYYLPALQRIFVQFPAWWMSLVSRLVEGFFWSGVLIRLPDRWGRQIAESATFADEDASERHVVGHLCGAALFMLMGLALSHWL